MMLNLQEIFKKDFFNIFCVKFLKRLNRLLNNYKIVNEIFRDICFRLYLRLLSIGIGYIKN